MIRSTLVQLRKLLAAWKGLVAVVAVVAVTAMLVLALVWAERESSRAVAMKYAPRPRIQHNWWKKRGLKQITRPLTVKPDKTRLPEDASVIGVVVDGKARAYAVTTLSGVQHVVNDVIGGVPITVTHCDNTGCTRVYTNRERSDPLDVAQAGFRDNNMVLKIKGVYYEHSTGEPIEPGPGSPPLPYEGYPWIQTTWKDWKEQHPETDIYVELRPEDPSP